MGDVCRLVEDLLCAPTPPTPETIASEADACGLDPDYVARYAQAVAKLLENDTDVLGEAFLIVAKKMMREIGIDDPDSLDHSDATAAHVAEAIGRRMNHAPELRRLCLQAAIIDTAIQVHRWRDAS